MRIWDPIVDGDFLNNSEKYKWNIEPQLFLLQLNTKNLIISFYPGSVIIDPWRFISSKKNIKLIRVGDSKE